jgi:hypothetical protein
MSDRSKEVVLAIIFLALGLFMLNYSATASTGTPVSACAGISRIDDKPSIIQPEMRQIGADALTRPNMGYSL